MFASLSNVQESNHPALTQVFFQGQYRMEDGPWLPIGSSPIRVPGSSVTLRGSFFTNSRNSGDPIPLAPGAKIALYLDHLGCTIQAEGCPPYALETESPAMGKSGCAQRWEIYTWPGSDGAVEITLRNPHRYGNTDAVSSLLQNLYLCTGDSDL